jgi:ATP-dependent Clp protease adaptor protein ClpS
MHESEVIVRPKSKEKTKESPRYLVILLDDNFHSHEYVIEMCQKLFGYPRQRGELIACEVDAQGEAIVWGPGSFEVAELKLEQIHAFGKDPLIKACQGSMSAKLEKV